MNLLGFEEYQSFKRTQGIEKWSNKIIEILKTCNFEDYDSDYYDYDDIAGFFNSEFESYVSGEFDIVELLNDLDINQLDILALADEIKDEYLYDDVTPDIIAYYILEDIFNNLFCECENLQEIKELINNN